MAQIINMDAFKQKKQEKQYLTYYGTPFTVQQVKRPQLHLVEEQALVEQELFDISHLLEELEKEGIQARDIQVIQPDPSIPW